MSGAVYRTPSSPLRPGWAGLLAAAVLAGLTLSVLPLLEMVAPRRRDRLALRPAPGVIPPPPAAMLRRSPEMARQETKPRPKLESPRPRLERPKRPPRALETQLALAAPSLLAGAGDFSIEFEVAGSEEPAPGGIESPGMVLGLAELDAPVRPLSRVNPIYPEEARRRRIEGFVELLFTIRRDGRTEDIRAVRSEPGTTFVEPALEAVRRWRFTRPEKDGEPVAVRARQMILFELR